MRERERERERERDSSSKEPPGETTYVTPRRPSSPHCLKSPMSNFSFASLSLAPGASFSCAKALTDCLNWTISGVGLKRETPADEESDLLWRAAPKVGNVERRNIFT